MQVYASHHELGKTAGHSAEDEGFDCQFAEGKLYGSHPFLNWWQQVSTGHLHLNGFESLSEATKNAIRMDGVQHTRMRDSIIKKVATSF